MSSALVFGATGATGKHILSNVLGMKEYTKVGEFGRRVTPLESIVGDKSKLVQKTVDFEKIAEEPDLKQHWDVVYIALGTTRADAGSAAAFEKIDREYVLAAAKAAKSSGTQRIVYISAAGADKNSSFLYMRSKGLTEEGLAALKYDDTIILRPGFIAGVDRGNLAIRLYGAFTSVAKHVSSSIEVQASELGKAAALAGYLGSSRLPQATNASTVNSEGGKYTLINNAGALHLAKQSL